MSLEQDDVVSALETKGFKFQGDRSHDYYWLYVDGIKQQINTHISHGSRHKTLGDDLVWSMAMQLKITTKQFRELVQCTLSEDAYISLLRSRQIRLTEPPKPPVGPAAKHKK